MLDEAAADGFEFSYQRGFRGVMPEAYERLLLDALEGDAALSRVRMRSRRRGRSRPDSREWQAGTSHRSIFMSRACGAGGKHGGMARAASGRYVSVLS
jgi:hypothetical protein